MKKTLQITGLLALFFASFVLFFYLSFPYGVLKETVAAKLSQESGYSVHIGELGPRIPLGLKAEDVRLDPPAGEGGLAVEGLSAGVGLLDLLVGRIGLDALVENDGGWLGFEVDFSLFKLLSGAAMPSQVALEAKNFPIDDAAHFGLSAASGGTQTNPMLAPLLETVGLSAKLNGKVDFELDGANPSQSTGRANLKFSNAFLKLSDPSLGLPDQQFQKAQIGAIVKGGTVVISEQSGLFSSELEMAMKGKIKLKPALQSSMLDLNVIITLKETLKDKFGFLVDAMVGGGGSKGGSFTVQMRGPLTRPSVSTF